MTATEIKITQFTKQFTAAHLEFAKLAAFPIGVTVDMLYQLWYNFKDRIDGLPMLSVSDVVLSPLFRPMGNGIFEMDKEMRSLLLDQIRVDTEGVQKLNELAYFTQSYAQKRLNTERYASFRETLLMNAAATLDAKETLKAIIKRLQENQKANNRSEVLRLRELIELFAIQEMGKSAVKDSTFYPLLQYSIALKGAYINAPVHQIQQKFESITHVKGLSINISKDPTPTAEMLQLPRSLVEKGILQKLNTINEQDDVTKTQILALIVGVNEYQSFSLLNGAVNDAHKIEPRRVKPTS